MSRFGFVRLLGVFGLVLAILSLSDKRLYRTLNVKEGGTRPGMPITESDPVRRSRGTILTRGSACLTMDVNRR